MEQHRKDAVPLGNQAAPPIDPRLAQKMRALGYIEEYLREKNRLPGPHRQIALTSAQACSHAGGAFALSASLD